MLDWRGLPLATAATLAQGLPVMSRVRRAQSGIAGPELDTLLLATIADRLGHIAWMFSDNGSKGIGHPSSLTLSLLGVSDSDTSDTPLGFENGADFMAAWAAVTGGEADGHGTG